MEAKDLRDFFAAMALIGLVRPCCRETIGKEAETAAQEAYEYADAMLKERGKHHAGF